MKVIL